jgi:hypothetical protein
VSRIALLSEEALVNYMVISYCVQDSPFIRGRYDHAVYKGFL